MYGSETWTLTKKNEGRLIVFENKVLRKIFGPICDEGVQRELLARTCTWRQEGTRLKEVYQAAKDKMVRSSGQDVTRCGGSVDLAEDRVAWKRLIDEAKNRLRFVTPRHGILVQDFTPSWWYDRQ
ncbi:hypothetical protein J6590_045870 [Homalodisca vitripennis]|nr:hypothetical protein J6590_045870 [Homalodisca vitripennis]